MENNEHTTEKLTQILYELQRLNKNFESLLQTFSTDKRKKLLEGEYFMNNGIGSTGDVKKSEK